MKQSLNVLFNFRSKEGRASDYFKKLEPELSSKFDLKIIELDHKGLWQKAISSALDQNETRFAAAGGDGTVHALLNVLAKNALEKGLNLENLYLGAVGLGSSNDFHKPLLKSKMSDLPIRLNFDKASSWDIVRAVLIDEQNRSQTIFFSISGSLGLVAEANAFFNGKDLILKILKRNWTQGAILYSAIREILINTGIHVSMDDQESISNVNALCFLKTNFLSGSLRINQKVSHSDGKISFVLMKSMNKAQLIKTLNELENNIFKKSKSLTFFQSETLKLSFKEELNIELDGEIYRAKKMELSLHPQKIMVASNE